jgi:hypothetical protein
MSTGPFHFYNILGIRIAKNSSQTRGFEYLYEKRKQSSARYEDQLTEKRGAARPKTKKMLNFTSYLASKLMEINTVTLSPQIANEIFRSHSAIAKTLVPIFQILKI